jgi:hypothetical protein
MRFYPPRNTYNVLQFGENVSNNNVHGVTGADLDISDFKILKELSRGDGGAVLKALWMRKNKNVVCKLSVI